MEWVNILLILIGVLAALFFKKALIFLKNKLQPLYFCTPSERKFLDTIKLKGELLAVHRDSKIGLEFYPDDKRYHTVHSHWTISMDRSIFSEEDFDIPFKEVFPNLTYKR